MTFRLTADHVADHVIAWAVGGFIASVAMRTFAYLRRRRRKPRPPTPEKRAPVAVDNVWIIAESTEARRCSLRRVLEQRAGLSKPLSDAQWSAAQTN